MFQEISLKTYKIEPNRDFFKKLRQIFKKFFTSAESKSFYSEDQNIDHSRMF